MNIRHYIDDDESGKFFDRSAYTQMISDVERGKIGIVIMKDINGMAERFNGRISDVLKTHRFDSGKDMCQTIERYVYLYNHQLPQSVLHSRTPMQELERWYNEKPELFQRQPRVPNRPGCNTYP